MPKRPAKQVRIQIDSKLFSCDCIVTDRRALAFLRAFRKEYGHLIKHYSFVCDSQLLFKYRNWWESKERCEELKEGGCKILITRV